MFFLIAGIFLLIYAALVFYIGWSGWRWLKPKEASKIWGILYAAAIGVVAGAWIMGHIFGNTVLRIIGSYWMALFCVLLMVLPLAQLTVRLLSLTRLPERPVEKAAAYFSLLAAAALLGTGMHNAYSPVVRTYEIWINKPNPDAERLTIVMAADMHFGLLSGRDHAKRMAEEINALKPDLVLFAGDIIDDDIGPYEAQGIPEILRRIDAPLGVYASLGNHDRYEGAMEDVIAAIERGGVNVLYDELEHVPAGITLAGRKDRSDRSRAPLEELLAGADRSRPLILLDHQPFDLEEALKAGVDLMLSGHTHGGQVAPGNLITRAIYEIDHGHLKKGPMHVIVTSGYGFWGPPLRLGTRSELVRIVVHFGS